MTKNKTKGFKRNVELLRERLDRLRSEEALIQGVDMLSLEERVARLEAIAFKDDIPRSLILRACELLSKSNLRFEGAGVIPGQVESKLTPSEEELLLKLLRIIINDRRY